MNSEIYDWDQEYDDVTITIPLKEGTQKKDISINLEKQENFENYLLEIKIKSIEPQEKDTVDKVTEINESNEIPYIINMKKELFSKVSKEFLWYVDDKTLTIEFQKSSSTWWESAFKDDDKKIDVEELAAKKMSDLSHLDSQTKQSIEKMMFEQRMNRK